MTNKNLYNEELENLFKKEVLNESFFSSDKIDAKTIANKFYKNLKPRIKKAVKNNATNTSIYAIRLKELFSYLPKDKYEELYQSFYNNVEFVRSIIKILENKFSSIGNFRCPYKTIDTHKDIVFSCSISKK